MKKFLVTTSLIILWTTSVLGLGGMGITGETYQDPRDSLIMEYRFSGDDICKITGLEGTFIGSPSVENGVLDLTGSSTALRLSQTFWGLLKDQDDATFALWFKGTTAQSLIRFQNSNGYYILNWGTNRKSIHDDDGATTTGLDPGSTHRATMQEDEWHHIAVTRERNTTDGWILYLDGVAIVTDDANDNDMPTWSITDSYPYLGSYQGSSEFAVGEMDDVRIYTKALSAAEIWALYKLGRSDPIEYAEIRSPASGTTRNNYAGVVGHRFVMNKTVTVTHLGRSCYAADTLSHTVRIYNDSLGVLASASVDASGPTVDNTWVYTALTTPITLTNGHAYSVASSETNGGDSWHSYAAYTIAPEVTITHRASGTGTTPNTETAGATAWGPNGFLFQREKVDIPHNGMIHRWRPAFQQNMYDDAGSLDATTYVNATIDADGLEDEYAQTDAVVSQGTDYTVAFWAKWDTVETTSSASWLLNDRTSTGAAYYDWQVYYYGTDADILQVAVWNTGQGTSTKATIINAIPTVSTWYHVAFSVNNTTKKITPYVDGVKGTDATFTGTPADLSPELTFNTAAFDLTSYPFEGTTDEIIIWNRVLSDDEIERVYRAQSGDH